MPVAREFILPVLTLVAWSGIMLIWTMAVRLPAIAKAKLVLDPNKPQAEQMNTLPPSARWKADNYNHLMEQPTIFYATALSLVLLNVNNPWALRLTWAYVALRIVHSVFQSLVNIIEVRFAIFALSTLALFGMVAIGLNSAL